MEPLKDFLHTVNNWKSEFWNSLDDETIKKCEKDMTSSQTGSTEDQVVKEFTSRFFNEKSSHYLQAHPDKTSAQRIKNAQYEFNTAVVRKLKAIIKERALDKSPES